MQGWLFLVVKCVVVCMIQSSFLILFLYGRLLFIMISAGVRVVLHSTITWLGRLHRSSSKALTHLLLNKSLLVLRRLSSNYPIPYLSFRT